MDGKRVARGQRRVRLPSDVLATVLGGWVSRAEDACYRMDTIDSWETGAYILASELARDPSERAAVAAVDDRWRAFLKATLDALQCPHCGESGVGMTHVCPPTRMGP